MTKPLSCECKPEIGTGYCYACQKARKPERRPWSRTPLTPELMADAFACRLIPPLELGLVLPLELQQGPRPGGVLIPECVTERELPNFLRRSGVAVIEVEDVLPDAVVEGPPDA